MPASAKPGIDWNEIRRQVEAGESVSSVAEEHGLSRTAIMKRRDGEGWQVAGGVRAPKPRTPAAQVPVPVVSMPAAKLGECSLENRAVALGAIEEGLPVEMVAKLIGLSLDELRGWYEAEPAFRMEADAALARWVQVQMKRVDAAGDRGDWKASMTMLERVPATRELFGNTAARGNGGPSINVVINVPDPSGTRPTIDVTPA